MRLGSWPGCIELAVAADVVVVAAVAVVGADLDVDVAPA